MKGIDYNVETSSDGNIKDIDIEYSYYEDQKAVKNDFLSGNHDIVHMRAGYSAGKSVTGARAIIEGVLKYGGRWLIMGITYQDAKQATFKAFKENLPGSNTYQNPENSPIVKDYNANNKEMTFINDGFVNFASSENYENKAGGEYNGIWLDEVAHYNNANIYHLLEVINTRLRIGEPYSILMTTTGNGYNDYYDFVDLGLNEEGEDHSWNIKQHRRIDTRSNKFLPDKVKKDLVRRNKENLEQAIKGGILPSSGTVFNKFDKDMNVVDYSEVKDELVDGFHVYGYDYGFKDPAVVVHIRKTARNRLVVVDNYYETESEIEDIINYLNSKPAGVVYCDHAPEDRVKINRKTDMKALNADKIGKEQSKKKLNNRFTESNGVIGLQICESRAKDTWKEFGSITEDQSDPDDHAIDATRYVISSLNQHEIERYSEVTEDRSEDEIDIVVSQTNKSDRRHRQRNKRRQNKFKDDDLPEGY